MDKVVLRDFQETVKSGLYLAWEDYDAVGVTMPTGAGKTELAASVIEDFREEYGEQDKLFAVHRTDLVNQTADRFTRYGIPLVKGSGSQSQWKSGKRPSGLVVMCVQTLKRRVQQDPRVLEGLKLSFFDEMHWYPDEASGKSAWGSVVAATPGKKAGLSATVWRMGIEESFSPTWEALVNGPQTYELINKGWLADYVVKDVEASVRRIQLTGKMRIASSQDSIDTTAVWNYYKDDRRGALTTEAVGIWYDQAKERQTIVFALTVDHAMKLKATFNGFKTFPGMPECEQVSEVIVGNTPENERKIILAKYAAGKIRVLIGVDVMREGFDSPEASCLLNLRPTDSLALWRQMCGRVLRPKLSGIKALILDLAGNYSKLGFPDDPMNWTLEARGRLKEGNGSPYKRCDRVSQPATKCLTINAIAQQVCIDPDCRAEFGKICSTDNNGCGEWRPWRRWEGTKLTYKPGCCDLCGEEAYNLQIELTRQDRLDNRNRDDLAREEKRKQEIADEKLRLFNERMEREHQLLLKSKEMRQEQFAQIKHLQENPDAWIWKPANSGNGFTVDFANCRVWVGSRHSRFTWSVFSYKDATSELDSRIKRMSKMAEEFLTLEEATNEISTIFNEEIKEENRQFLMGKRCTCLNEYINTEEEPKCMTIEEPKELTAEEVESFMLERRKSLLKEFGLPENEETKEGVRQYA